MADQQDWAVVRRRRRVTETGDPEVIERPPGAAWLAAAVAGLLLLLPGFLTDLVGFLLLVPPLRRRLIRRYIHIVPVPTAGPDRGPRVIEGRWRRED